MGSWDNLRLRRQALAIDGNINVTRMWPYRYLKEQPIKR